MAETEHVLVKPLSWVQNWPNDPLTAFASADHINRTYTVDRDGSRFYVSSGVSPYDSMSDAIGNFGSFEEAKAAAQSDYEQRIRSALHPAPDAREAGLRNIRTIIEEWREGKPTGASDFAMGRITAILINLLSPDPVVEKVETDGSEREIDWNEPASRSP